MKCHLHMSSETLCGVQVQPIVLAVLGWVNFHSVLRSCGECFHPCLIFGTSPLFLPWTSTQCCVALCETRVD